MRTSRDFMGEFIGSFLLVLRLLSSSIDLQRFL